MRFNGFAATRAANEEDAVRGDFLVRLMGNQNDKLPLEEFCTTCKLFSLAGETQAGTVKAELVLS